MKTWNKIITLAIVILSMLIREIFLVLARRDVGVLFENANEVLVVAEADVVSNVVDFVVS